MKARHYPLSEPKTIQHLRRAFGDIKSGTAGDVIFIAQAMMYLCEQAAQRRNKPRRPQTPWQRYFGAGIKAGKAPQQIGAEWRARRSA